MILISIFFPDPVVRSELMGQFPHIVSFCNENGLNGSVQTYMMPVLINYLGAENNQVSSLTFFLDMCCLNRIILRLMFHKRKIYFLKL